MNFDLSEDEEMVKALAERFVVDHYDIESRRRFLAEPDGFSARNWSLLGDLGLIAALFDAEAGGLDLDATGIATLFEALGRGLVVEPLIENVLLAGRLFAATAPEPLREAWLPDLLSGRRRTALAHVEAGGRDASGWIETRLAADGTLHGAKAYVPAAGGVDGFVVSARLSGAPADREGAGLFFVATDAPGLTIQPWRMADGLVAASLRFDGVEARRLAGGLAEIAAAEELASLARAAEALGIMESLLAETLEYLRTREQFGARLASFQALQHRMVAHYAATEQARGLLNLAMVSWGQPAFASAVLGVRAFVSEVSVALGHDMIQFHGGMGVTDELSIGHGHKRLLVLSRWPDGPDAALDRFAAAGG
ncbi:MAG: acyl-CoA dehydrogenase [Novosphingobium sp.]|nr:MAG: acyl-CoA dehydrogenase [Novosphingobium sp.]